mgnify:CR=1 FL=1
MSKTREKTKREIIKRFNSPNLTIKSWDLTESFQLENGLSKMKKWFKNVYKIWNLEEI